MSDITKVRVAGVVFKSKGKCIEEVHFDKLVDILSTGYCHVCKVDESYDGNDVIILVRKDDGGGYEAHKSEELYSISTQDGDCLYMGTGANGTVEYIVPNDCVIDAW